MLELANENKIREEKLARLNTLKQKKKIMMTMMTIWFVQMQSNLLS